MPNKKEGMKEITRQWLNTLILCIQKNPDKTPSKKEKRTGSSVRTACIKISAITLLISESSANDVKLLPFGAASAGATNRESSLIVAPVCKRVCVRVCVRACACV